MLALNRLVDCVWCDASVVQAWLIVYSVTLALHKVYGMTLALYRPG